MTAASETFEIPDVDINIAVSSILIHVWNNVQACNYLTKNHKSQSSTHQLLAWTDLLKSMHNSFHSDTRKTLAKQHLFIYLFRFGRENHLFIIGSMLFLVVKNLLKGKP